MPDAKLSPSASLNPQAKVANKYKNIISSLGLREISRQAVIVPNSFYRHFHDVDELAIVLKNVPAMS